MTNIIPLNIPTPKGRTAATKKGNAESEKSGKEQNGDVSNLPGLLFNPLLAQMLAQQIPLSPNGAATSTLSSGTPGALPNGEDGGKANGQTNPFGTPIMLPSVATTTMLLDSQAVAGRTPQGPHADDTAVVQNEGQKQGGTITLEPSIAAAMGAGIHDLDTAPANRTIQALQVVKATDTAALEMTTIEGTKAEKSANTQGKSVDVKMKANVNLQNADHIVQAALSEKTGNGLASGEQRINTDVNAVKLLDSNASAQSKKVAPVEDPASSAAQKAVVQVSGQSFAESRSNQSNEGNQTKDGQGQDHLQRQTTVSKPGQSGSPAMKDLVDALKQQSLVVDTKADVSQATGSSQAVSPRVSLADLVASIHEQIANSISLKLPNHVSEMRVALKPESLGEVVVNVRMEDNTMVARIDVSHQNVKAMLDANIAQLHEVLVNKGIRVDRIDVLDASNASMRDSNSNPRGKPKGSSKNKPNDSVETLEPMRQLGYNTLEYLI